MTNDVEQYWQDEPIVRGMPRADQLGVVGELFTVHLQRVEYLLSRATAQAWEGQSLRSGTIGVLSLIVKYPGIYQNEIVKRTTLDRSAVNLIVKNLEKLGWAEKQKTEGDRKRQALHATDVGAAELVAIVGRIKAIETGMLSQVSAPMIKQLRELLDLVHASCLAKETH